MVRNLIILVLAATVLVGCQVIQPLVNVSETVSGTVEAEKQKQIFRTQAIVKCQELCQQLLTTDGEIFDRGLCLSNSIAPDWVCDMVHVPRQPLDDEAENQCPAFRNGSAHHFVEIDGNCNVVEIY
jgi:hypothetical protein